MRFYRHLLDNTGVYQAEKARGSLCKGASTAYGMRGRLKQASPGALPRYVRYLDEQRGRFLNNIWVDIPNINSMAKERTGYPTQKPQALARRIIEAGSQPNDLVLDCFAGCAYVPSGSGTDWSALDSLRHVSSCLDCRSAAVPQATGPADIHGGRIH